MSKPEGISISIIAKNCPNQLKDCLNSVKDFVRPDLGDEIVVVDTGSSDNTPLIAEDAGALVHRHPELNVSGMLDLVKQYLPNYYKLCKDDPQFSDGFLADFAGARELAYSLCKNDVKFWLDSDDIVIGNTKFLREVCIREFPPKEEKPGRVIFLQYDYCFEEDGACNTVLWRERLCRSSEYIWKGACHESLIPRPGIPIDLRRVDANDIKVSHKHGRAHVYSDIRNYVIMRKALLEGTWKDPRLQYYLGHASRGLAQTERWSPYLSEAINWYNQALRRSGSRDDRYSMLLNIGYILLNNGRAWRAIDWFMEASKCWTEEPRSYFGLGQCYYELHKYKEALAWINIGRAFARPDHITAVDPLAFDYLPTYTETQSFVKLKQYDRAMQSAQRLVQMRPTHPAPRDIIQQVQIESNRERVKISIGATMDLAFSPQAAKEILHLLKPEVRREFKEMQLETFATPPKKSITFICNPTLETWDPTDLDGKGVGGSEKMVILLAREFAKRGWAVDVYGNPDFKNAYKDFNGVVYRPIESFNISFPRDIIVLWRAANLLNSPFRSRKLFLDLHDVTPDNLINPHALNKCSGIFFKSNFHASLTPSVNGKAIITRNAVDLSTLSDKPKIPGKVIWSSSPDRGLLGALRAWSYIMNWAEKNLPYKPELHVCYGFTPLYIDKAAAQEYEPFSDEGCDRLMFDYMEECFELMDNLGVKYHSRVGHSAMMQHFAESEAWLYPTEFPEISCMSAMEAQCSGAIPVCSHFGALKETVTWGCEVACRNIPQIAGALQKVLSGGEELAKHRLEMIEDSKKKFALTTLVDQWEQEFNK